MKRLLFPFMLVALMVGITSPTIAQTAPINPKIVMNHLAFQVNDLKVSTDFYTKLVGLDTIPEPFHDGRHTWLSLGNGSHLHLITSPAGAPVIPGKNTHLCLSVPSVDAVVKLLELNKVHYEDWPGKPLSVTTRVDGVKQIYFQDPNGYWIEINDARE